METDPQKTSKKALKTEAAFDQLASAARRKVLRSISKYKKLINNLNSDLEKHGDPERWKRYGDLLLANVNARREGDRIVVTDYFDPATPAIEIEADSNSTVTEAAESYFRRYAKARNGVRIIHERLTETEAAIEKADAELRQIDGAIESRDVEFLQSLNGPEKKTTLIARQKKHELAFKGARRFMSSDGFEILVGKKAADNDFLTFRIARSLDIWMHAADYPGSHVVVRNPNRREVSNKTLIEAAQLAAFYSSGNKQTKAAVNYTQKKFVNKPRRSAPGLVSLSSFRTILVEPKVGDVTRL